MKGSLLYYFIGFALVPLVAAGLFVAFVRIQVPSRYDEAYFTRSYQELYQSPSSVAAATERVLKSDNPSLYAELTGLRKVSRLPKPNPNMVLTILLEVDEAGYFHYLYFDIKTYRRATYYIKEEMNRWILVPQDAYFYLDSGRWMILFTPLAVIWWSVLLVIGLAMLVFRQAARIREERYRVPGK